MATLKLTIFRPKVLKDGRHKIRVALCHKGVTSYITTQYIVEESQLKNGQVVKAPDAAIVNRRLRKLLDTYQDCLDNITDTSIYSCTQLRTLLVNFAKKDGCTFSSVSEEYIQELEGENRHNYAILLERNLRYFSEFLDGDMLMADITPVIVESYARYLRVKKKLSETTVNMMISRTRTIINRAIRLQLVKYDVHPLITTHIPSAPVRELDISLESFNRIRLSSPHSRRTLVARDLFLLSFYLGGINLIDLLNIDFRSDKVEYIRTKSRNTTQGAKSISFSLPDAAKPIVKKWMCKSTGKLDFRYNYTYSNFSRYLSRSIHILAEELGIAENISFYSARKTFAQFASELGIPDSIIDYCLGHSDKSKGVIRYYTKVKEKQADMAISRVIDYVKNPDRYTEYLELRSDIMLMRV